MIKKRSGISLWLVVALSTCSCSMYESSETVILLPGQFKGSPMVLGETSASNISINQNLVPSLIVKVWWNDRIIITQNHPMTARNKFAGDTYEIPDRTRLCWYLIDWKIDFVQRFDDYDHLLQHVKALGIDPSEVALMKLHDAQQLRENQLGFKFTAASVNRFLRSGREQAK